MTTRILLLFATIFLCCCNPTNTQNNNKNVVEDSTSKEIDLTNFGNDFFSVKELNLPASSEDFRGYFIKRDTDDYYNSLNPKMLVGKKIYFCENIEFDVMRSAKVSIPKTVEEVKSLIDNDNFDIPDNFFIPVFKITKCNSFVLGYLTYIYNDEGGNLMASLELNAYNSDGQLLLENPVAFSYEGGGEDGTVIIESTISNDCIIEMRRVDKTYTKVTETGNLEPLDAPLISNTIINYKISGKGIQEIK